MVVDLEVDNSTMAMVQVDLTAINAALTLPVHNNQPLSEAGCLWMANDWSCAFDAVFMALFSIYRRSSLLWQECWRAESTINEFLVEQFDRIFEAFSSDLDFFTLSTLFSECRDNFRDWMFAVNHQKFPRRGKQLAGVSDILEYFSDQHNGSMDLERTRLCSNPACPPAITTRNINHICHPSVIEKYWRIRDTVSIQSVVTQELSSILDQPLISKCTRCPGYHTQSTWSMAALTWVWFEIFNDTHILPSLTLTMDRFGEPRTFVLTAVMYLGGAHFTARWRDHSGIWWKHDGIERNGAPVVDGVNSESDLRQCDGRRMSHLIYSFEHDV